MGYSRYTCVCCFEWTHCYCSATRQYSHQYTYVFLLGDLKKKLYRFIYIYIKGCGQFLNEIDLYQNMVQEFRSKMVPSVQ